ncbi:hypothetical protein [Salaquimonas pukyongi]|uniref:hypothetical protein n=1 Tax=Salaquimonas pukyongi TaxID=2712698 RepID=UPI0012EC9CC5|nr:hypothetical protein [Salaquimonas pukyongi]
MIACAIGLLAQIRMETCLSGDASRFCQDGNAIAAGLFGIFIMAHLLCGMTAGIGLLYFKLSPVEKEPRESSS